MCARTALLCVWRASASRRRACVACVAELRGASRRVARLAPWKVVVVHAASLAIPTMPELPEIFQMSVVINTFGKRYPKAVVKVEKSAVHKSPDIALPASWTRGASVCAVAQGKQLFLLLAAAGSKEGKAVDAFLATCADLVLVEGKPAIDAASWPFADGNLLNKGCALPVQQSPSGKCLFVLMRMGMSGYFRCIEPGDEALPKHAHLTLTARDGTRLCFVDMRRFSRWDVLQQAAWGADRGPDPVREHELFVAHVRSRLTASERLGASEAICELMLDQSLFNGVGNYMRAEILHRCGISPFANARAVLQSATTGPALLREVATVALEVIERGMLAYAGSGSSRYSTFEAWLQCYGVLDSTHDKLGRTVWFDGARHAVPAAYRDKRGRGMKRRASVAGLQVEAGAEAEEVEAGAVAVADKAKAEATAPKRRPAKVARKK